LDFCANGGGDAGINGISGYVYPALVKEIEQLKNSNARIKKRLTIFGV
jgi:hypothetical protein